MIAIAGLRRFIPSVPTLITIGVALAAYGYTLWEGRQMVTLQCQATTATQAAAATVQAASAAKAETVAQVASAASVGRAREAQRQVIDRHFQQLAQEAADAQAHQPDGAASCGLDADGLRRWRAANAGPWAVSAGEGPTTGQHHDGAASAAPAALGQPDGLGSEPPGGGSPVSPAGQPGLPAPAVPGRTH